MQLLTDGARSRRIALGLPVRCLWALFSFVLALPLEAAPYVYVANYTWEGGVVVIDARTQSVRDVIHVGRYSYGAALSPDGRRLYVPNQGDDSVSIVDTTTDVAVATVSVGHEPIVVVVSGDGTKIYALGLDGTICVISAALQQVVHIFPSTAGTAVGVVMDIALTPDGQHLYATQFSPYVVYEYDTATWGTLASMPFPDSPDGIGASPDGKFVYVSNLGSELLYSLDVFTNTIVGTTVIHPLDGGWTNAPVVVSPDGRKVYVGQRGRFTVGVVDTRSGFLEATMPAYYPTGIAFDAVSGLGYLIQSDLSYSHSIAVFSLDSDQIVGSIDLPAHVIANSRSGFVGFPMPLAYIANRNSASVSRLDTATKASTPATVGNAPDGLVVSTSGRTLYVSNSADGTVTILSAATLQAVDTIKVGNLPAGLRLSPDEGRLYVANSGDDSVSVIDTAARQVVSTVALEKGSRPLDIAISPDGATLYVTQGNLATVAVVSALDNTETDGIYLGKENVGLAMSSEGKLLYVSNGDSDSVTVVDTATNGILNTFSVGPTESIHYGSSGIAVSPNGKRCYVTNAAKNSVSVIDTATGHVALVQVGAGPTAVSVTPDGRLVYVANTVGNTISVIDATTNRVTSTLQGFNAPSAIGNFVEPLPNDLFASGFE